MGVESGLLAPEVHCPEVLVEQAGGRPACAGGAGPMNGTGRKSLCPWSAPHHILEPTGDGEAGLGGAGPRGAVSGQPSPGMSGQMLTGEKVQWQSFYRTLTYGHHGAMLICMIKVLIL